MNYLYLYAHLYTPDKQQGEMTNVDVNIPVFRKRMLIIALIFFLQGLTVAAADTATGADNTARANEPGQAQETVQDKGPDSRPDFARLRDSVRDYQTTIMELEKKGGANNGRISEQLIDLGRTYRELGQNDKAVEAFNRALQITRISLGPETDRQLPVLELIIETNKASADWEALEENYQYYYWISSRIYAADADQLLSVIYRLANWHLQAYLTNYDPIPYKHLLWSEKLFHDAVDLIDKHFGPDDPRLIPALYGIIISNYHIVSHRFNSSNNTDDMKEIHESAAIMSKVDNVSSMLIWEPVSYNIYAGKKVLKRIADILHADHELPLADRATALVDIGDWYFIYDWNNTAMKNYNSAYQLLTGTNSDLATFNRLFGNPVRIPTMTPGYPPADKAAGSETERPYIKFKFDVTREGCARRIRIIEESDPDKFMLRKHLKDYLHASLFRPKINSGKAVKALDVVMTLSGAVLKDGTDRRLVNYDRFDALITEKRCYNKSW